MKTIYCLAATLFLALAGCADSDAPSSHNDTASVDHQDASHDGHDHAHAHPTHGPHGGDLIELGKEMFHAELVHDQESVSIHVLDSTATEPVPVEATSLILSMKRDGSVQAFELLAKPEDAESTGQSSKFTTEDSTLVQWLDEGAVGAMTIEIDGKSYTGKVSHGHDHDHDHQDGHGHDHGHEDGDDHAHGDQHAHGDHDHAH